MGICTQVTIISEPKDYTDIIDIGSDNGQSDDATTRLDCTLFLASSNAFSYF